MFWRPSQRGECEDMANKGRPSGFVMTEEHRTKIKNSKILNRLIEAAEGKIEITPTQASVGLALMKKVFPDLQSVALTDHTHEAPAKLIIEWDDGR